MLKLSLLLIACLSVLVSTPMTLASRSQQPTRHINGIWATENNEAHVELCKKGGEIFGRFVRFLHEPPHGGLDLKNPDPSRRQQPLGGRFFIRNFEFDNGRWRHGRIYNPDNGREYKADLELTEGILNVRGWIGFRWLGRTVQWSLILQASPGESTCSN